MEESEILETNEEIETIENEWSDITLESTDDRISYGDGTSVIIDNPGSVQIITSGYSGEEEESVVKESYYDSVEAEDKMVLEDIRSASSISLRSLSSADLKNLWKLEIDSVEYSVLFPEGASLRVIDGKLVNMGTSNITGVIIDSSFSDSSYFSKTFTVMPFTSSSTQNSVYRYGARSYLTSYYVSTSTTLGTSVSYSTAEVIHRPYGWQISAEGLVLAALLLFLCLVNVIGGLLRR